MSASPRHPAFDQTKADQATTGGPPGPSEPAGKSAAGKSAAGESATGMPGTAKPADGKPAAGPHAKPSLTDPEKTPGTGALPDPHRPNEDATSG
jgi:hypothetical protein